MQEGTEITRWVGLGWREDLYFVPHTWVEIRQTGTACMNLSLFSKCYIQVGHAGAGNETWPSSLRAMVSRRQER
jgi:hypothetical protein